MKYGFLILNYNSWNMTKKLALKVEGFKCIDSIVIVDNVSTDNSYEMLKEIESNRIAVLLSDRNGGYSCGNNYGAKYCYEEGIDILFISNPDVDVEEVDVLKIIEGFEKTDCAVLSGVELNNNGEVALPPIWKMNRYSDDLLDCFYFGRRLRERRKKLELDSERYVQYVELVKGSFFATRLRDFLAVGGFDENVFLFCEERILGRKFSDAGQKIGVITAARYMHNHSASISRTYKAVAAQMRIMYKSRLYYNNEYNEISKVRAGILALAMKYSILEYSVRDWVRYIKRKIGE